MNKVDGKIALIAARSDAIDLAVKQIGKIVTTISKKFYDDLFMKKMVDINILIFRNICTPATSIIELTISFF